MYFPLSQYATIPMAPDDMYEVQEIIYLRWCYYFIVTTKFTYYPTAISECVVIWPILLNLDFATTVGFCLRISDLPDMRLYFLCKRADREKIESEQANGIFRDNPHIQIIIITTRVIAIIL